ncbi:hypothetical protein DY000_02055167 [Brassica cretica]|uniref:Uncharacterized protein n=1 Tax=Brassica cretica TaxID=69181 RepID=A0ABQ7AKX6_BRACR|nr:hypothetical protein DY000_02055167 [Brassica cretica]
MKNLVDHGQEIMDMKSWIEIMDMRSWTGNHGQKIMNRKSWTGKLKQEKVVEPVPETVPSTAADSVESTHPDHEGGSRNVEQSTQAQPEENSIAHDQDEITETQATKSYLQHKNNNNKRATQSFKNQQQPNDLSSQGFRQPGINPTVHIQDKLVNNTSAKFQFNRRRSHRRIYETLKTALLKNCDDQLH